MTDGTAGVTRTDAESLDTKSPPHEWERGWKLVAVSLVSYVFGSAGMFFAFGLFLKPLSSEFHWSREAISGFTSISGVLFALASPIVFAWPVHPYCGGNSGGAHIERRSSDKSHKHHFFRRR